MDSLPHHYSVIVNAEPENSLKTSAAHLPTIEVAPPRQFDGPGDKWSPEELLLAAAANCFVLSFRTVASIAKLEWQTIQCTTEGVLDKVERTMQFTEIVTRVVLTVEHEDSRSKAEKLLEKAEQICIVSNSLTATKHLEIEIIIL
ncbi:OsmC family protein [Zhongshania arctica]|uniref:OsmC family protein n=1 Tax=Zhongshania arctica TaxID=3238302 RepID=A0ABV3TVG7_9GAMM